VEKTAEEIEEEQRVLRENAEREEEKEREKYNAAGGEGEAESQGALLMFGGMVGVGRPKNLCGDIVLNFGLVIGVWRYPGSLPISLDRHYQENV
jgi:hypothetical protein